MTDTEGKRQNSRSWTLGAFTLTQPSEMVGGVVCIDDCPNCPLWKKGCAGRCARWDDLVCSGCPCLGSRYSAKEGVATVNPTTLEPEPIEPRILAVRARRQTLRDGEPVS